MSHHITFFTFFLIATAQCIDDPLEWTTVHCGIQKILLFDSWDDKVKVPSAKIFLFPPWNSSAFRAPIWTKLDIIAKFGVREEKSLIAP